MFVDEERFRYRPESSRIIGIDKRGKRDAKFLVVELRWRDALRIKGQSDDREAIAAILLEPFLPPGQVVAAESPTGPAIQNVAFPQEL